MDKQAFLAAIRSALEGLPQSDIDKTLDFYSEMIDDRMEEGLTEAEAVAAMGPPEEIAEQILLDTPLPKLVKRRVRPSRALRAGEIVLLVLGAPVWLPVLLALVVVVLSLFLALWTVILCLYAVVLALAVSGVAGIVGSIVHIFAGDALACLLVFGGGLVCLGAGVLLFFAFSGAAAGVARFSRHMWRAVKSWFIQKGDIA